MFKRALTLMMIVAAVGAAGLLSPGPVDATGHSATRSFSATSVIAGGTVEVTIEVAELGAFGGVVETLPDGFSYVSTTLESEPAIDGQDVTFALFGEDSFSYTVRAPDTLGAHTFDGVVKDNALDSNEVGGDSDVMVMASGLEASRSFSSSTVDAGGELTVTITAAGYGQFGQVVETLPAGFGYVSTSLPDPPWVSGQMLGFSLFGEESFTYTVTASRTLGSHEFSGVAKDEARMETAIGGRLHGDGGGRDRVAQRDQVRRLAGRGGRRGGRDDRPGGPRRLRPGPGDSARGLRLRVEQPARRPGRERGRDAHLHDPER